MNIEVTINIPFGQSADAESNIETTTGNALSATTPSQTQSTPTVELPPLPANFSNGNAVTTNGVVADATGVPPGIDELDLGWESATTVPTSGGDAACR